MVRIRKFQPIERDFFNTVSMYGNRGIARISRQLLIFLTGK